MAEIDENANMLENGKETFYYENWHGNQRFLFHGRIVLSKTQSVNAILTFLFITSVVTVFLYFM